MDPTIISAILALVGSLIGTFAGIVTSSKLTEYRLKELEKKQYQNVLISCHGGILRALCGYLEDRPRGIKWRPKPHNCEIRVYETVNGNHRFVEEIKYEK